MWGIYKEAVAIADKKKSGTSNFVDYTINKMIINIYYSKQLFNLFAMAEVSILLLLFFCVQIYNCSIPCIPSTSCFFLSIINFAFLVIHRRFLFAFRFLN